MAYTYVNTVKVMQELESKWVVYLFYIIWNMSREIKFRAWNKVAQFMMGRDEFIWYEYDQMKDFWFDDYRIFNDNEFVLMQYTGVQDKNKKDLYEWDLVKSNVNWKLYEIRRLNNHFYCGFVPRAIDWSNENLSFEHEFVIVGNVYENADLIK